MIKTIKYPLVIACLLSLPHIIYAQSKIFVDTTGDSTAIQWHGETNISYDIEYSLDLNNVGWTNSGVAYLGSNTDIRVDLTNIVEEPFPHKSFFRLLLQYPNNESQLYQDMLTPLYYNSSTGTSFRNEIDRFVYYCHKTQFHHPLKNSLGQTPTFNVSAEFGSEKGRDEPAQHHPAVDIRVGTGETNVNLFAAYAGYITTYRDADKYREYLAISNTITAINGDILGSMATLYAHIDLDLDEADGLIMDGQYVEKGDLVSQHLYSGTVGGPHLHFEVRYYRVGEAIDLEFYGLPMNQQYTEPSVEPWPYGSWDPNIGYGYGDPKNHGLVLY